MNRSVLSIPGRVPHWELEFQLWDAFSARKMTLGRDFERLTGGERERALHANAEIMAAVSVELGFAAVTAPSGYWEHAPGELAYWVLPPDGSVERQVEMLRRTLPPEILVVANSGGVLGMPAADEYVEFCFQMEDDPDAVEALAQRRLAAGVLQAGRLREAGAQMLLTATDIADNHGVFFAPAALARFVLPYLRSWAEAMHRLDALAVMHTDGNITAVLPELAASGIDILQGIDPVAGMELNGAFALAMDRIMLCGNLDCGLMLTGSPGEVYAAAAALLREHGSRDNWIFGMANASQPDVPPENYRAMCQAKYDYENKKNLKNKKIK